MEDTGRGTMLAGEAARVLAVGVQTLHFYERRRLIPPAPRSASGYRLYTPEILDRVRFIRKAQALGLSLDDIADVLTLVAAGEKPCASVRGLLETKLAEIDRRLKELHAFRAELAALLGSSPGRARGSGARVCSIVEGSPPSPGRPSRNARK